MSKEDDQTTIAALLQERRGYVNRGLDDRVAAIDAELKKLGHQAETKQKRASTRPAAKKDTEKR